MLLPLRFNDGQPVPDDVIADILLELERRFGAVSSETQTIQGLWRHQGQLYRDALVRVFLGRRGCAGEQAILSRVQRATEAASQADRHLDDNLSDRSLVVDRAMSL
jgi:hypothetical protein